MSEGPASWHVLSGGIVSANDESTIAEAIGSLQRQELPPGIRWGSIWVVASGCTDRTVQIAQQMTRSDPRVRVLEEPQRRGKAAALNHILRRADGDGLVLLNADAAAGPNAVGALLRAAVSRRPPLGVMGRPVAPPAPPTPLTGSLGFLWDLHHEFHVATLRDSSGTHLSDELLLLSLPTLPLIPEGTVNDGSYVGGWLAREKGTLLYAPEALVTIALPLTVADHVAQRRRILYGHAQSRRTIRGHVGTLPGFSLRRPRASLQIVRRVLRSRPSGTRELCGLAGYELAAWWLACWDQLHRRRTHVLWERIAASHDLGHSSEAGASGSGPLARPTPTLPERGV